MRAERVISNLPGLRDTLSVRLSIARKAASPQPAPEIIDTKNPGQACSTRADTPPYHWSPAFDEEGEFRMPASYGMNTYRNVEKNTRTIPGKGNNISVYA